MKEILIDVPVCNQRELSPEWAWRGCAICSLWMLLKWNNRGISVSPEELLKEGLTLNGYVENVGWGHRVITELGARHGMILDYAKKFYYTPEEKQEGLKLIAECLKAGKPVIASIFKELNHSKDGHLVVLRGIREFSGTVIGFDIQDPDPTWRGHNYLLARQEFLDGWRGGLIWPK
ncbi:MAG: hypothetical protein A3I39_02360 [Candidatus Yanofskybacteria bacterium RIFCSPLOWO2_02_FULL_47_9b]|uniref:Peptidase C39-like domain-containing protein n=1 Tax=Candidatus Yanofskybacteria bacterium RIFCSPLOWO2_02_FULL_47_9b TaxID=1802708 RepID=A0A1F8H7S6_9BACT|nr:MAG: hypothetical protein A3I39_02360 [Candidatus Yanofskybacteria bacterium RIFCSPLOWO2_02_FULL_47_9b]